MLRKRHHFRPCLIPDPLTGVDRSWDISCRGVKWVVWKEKMSKISMEFAIMCGGQSRVAEYCQSSFTWSRMVEDIQAARHRKANAEFLRVIRSISRVLEVIWRVILIDNMRFEHNERLSRIEMNKGLLFRGRGIAPNFSRTVTKQQIQGYNCDQNTTRRELIGL